MEVGALNQGGQVSYGNSKSNECKIDGQPNIKDQSITKGDKSKENNPSEKDIKKAVDKLNKFLEDNKTHAEYEVHDKFKDIMIKIVDDKSGKVIQEFPPKKILDMVAKMCEIVGVLFDKKA